MMEWTQRRGDEEGDVRTNDGMGSTVCTPCSLRLPTFRGFSKSGNATGVGSVLFLLGLLSLCQLCESSPLFFLIITESQLVTNHPPSSNNRQRGRQLHAPSAVSLNPNRLQPPLAAAAAAAAAASFPPSPLQPCLLPPICPLAHTSTGVFTFLMAESYPART